MKSQKKILLIAVTLSLCVATRIAFAMCQYAATVSVSGTTTDCSSGCVQYLYSPAITQCTNTCDTLTCRDTGDTMTTQINWAIGTCNSTFTGCINVNTGVTPGAVERVYISDDGCTTPCGG
jgi:hypothetical protein